MNWGEAVCRLKAIVRTIIRNGGVRSHALVHIQYPAQRWTAFEGIGPGPCGRHGQAKASDGRRVFVLGGALSLGAQVDEEAKLIHVLDTSYTSFLSLHLDGLQV